MQAAIAQGDAAIAAFTDAWGGEGAVVVTVDAPTALEAMIASLIRWRSMRQRLSRRACMRPLVRHGAVSSTFWRASRPDLEHVEAEVLETAPVELRLSPSFAIDCRSWPA